MGLERARIRRSSLDRMVRATSAGFKLRARGRGGGGGRWGGGDAWGQGDSDDKVMFTAEATTAGALP